jgi:hypothetical protein
MSTPNANTPLFPSSAAALTVADVDFTPSFVYVGTTGNLTVVPAEGPDTNTVLFSALPAGQVVPIQVKGIRSSGTTAGSLVRIW